jgi:cystathionine beta-lyase/cystathionine gamma-synthase
VSEDPRPRPRRSDAFEPLPPWAGPATTAIHGARRPERNAGATVPPIFQTSNFRFPAEFSDAPDADSTRIYTRYTNPTNEVAAELIRRLEGAEAGAVFASGMGAIASTLLTFLSNGDEVVALSELYGGTLDLLHSLLPRFGIAVRWIPPHFEGDATHFLGPKSRVLMLETPTNPTLQLVDLEAWTRAADAVGAHVVVDNTFATPVNQNPLRWGADVVVHSASKYLGGHSDLIAGAVAGSEELVGRIQATGRILGPSLDPFAGFLLTRGIRTLPLRVARQNENGRRVADALLRHPRVERVHYPGFGDPAQEEIARRQMAGRGGMVTIVVHGGLEGARRFLHGLKIVQVAASLGGVESLASLPKETSHARLNEEELAARGIAPGMVRLSLGIEDADDLIRDLSEALDGVGTGSPPPL